VFDQPPLNFVIVIPSSAHVKDARNLGKWDGRKARICWLDPARVSGVPRL